MRDCYVRELAAESIIQYIEGHDAQKGFPYIKVPGRRLKYFFFWLILRRRGAPQEELPVFRSWARQEVVVEYLYRPENNILTWKSKMARQDSRVLYDMVHMIAKFT